MNVDRILALADVIEAQPHTRVSDPYGFNMENWRHHNCGTPSCIAGWAAALSRGDTKGITGIPVHVSDIAIEYLDLDDEQAHDLFCPPGHDWESITPSDAAATLRLFAETGKVKWAGA